VAARVECSWSLSVLLNRSLRFWGGTFEICHVAFPVNPLVTSVASGRWYRHTHIVLLIESQLAIQLPDIIGSSGTYLGRSLGMGKELPGR